MHEPRFPPTRTSRSRTPGAGWRVRLLATIAVLGIAAGACGSSSGGGGDLLAVPVVDLAEEGDTDLATVADGRPLVVNLWASWCVPCLEEMPAFDRVHRARNGEVAIVGVTDDDLDDATRMAERTGATYPLVIDAERTIARELGAAGLPLTVFLSPEGEVLGRHQGALDDDGLTAEIDRYWGAS